MPKKYLGDSVYFEFDGYSVVLTTENGYGPSNTIIMEPEVIMAFTKALADLADEVKKMKDLPKN